MELARSNSMGTINVIHPTATGSVPTQTSFPVPSKRPPPSPAATQFSLPRPPATVHDLLSSLRLSASRSKVDLARATHAVFLKLFHDNTLLGNSVISTYLELGRLQDARHVFDGLPAPDVASYSALMSGFAKSGLEDEAVELFGRMRNSGIEPNGYSFVAVLTACMRLLDKELGSQVHGLCVKLGCGESVFVCNALMGLYGKCGCLDYVVKVFDEMPRRDVTSWNTLISSFVLWDCWEKGLEAFREMGGVRGFGIGVDQITLSTGLTACSGCRAVMLGREIHARAIRTGLDAALSIGNDLIGFYTDCGGPREAEAVFERMKMRNVVTWTEMLNGYMEFGMTDEAVELFDRMPERNCISYASLLAGLCENGRASKVLDLFLEMIVDGRELTDFILTSVLKACGMVGQLELSRQVHGFVTKSGIGPNESIGTALVDMCKSCGRMMDAEKLLKSWPFEQAGCIFRTSILCEYARNGLPDEAISFFIRCYLDENLVIDEVALTSVLGVIGTLGQLELSRQIHGFVTKSGIGPNEHIGAALIDMCTRCGRMMDAEKLLKSWPFEQAGCIIRTSILCGYARNGLPDEAISFFIRCCFDETLVMDEVALASVLSVCGTLGQLELSRQVHGFVTKSGIVPNERIGAALIDMCTRCGRMMDAEKLLKSWPFEQAGCIIRTSILCGYARNGLPDEAISFFIRCCFDETLVMDEVALVSVLRVCGTLGQLELSRQVHGFVMKSGVGPNERIGAALIDMCTRCGRLMDAEKLLKSWPFEQAGSIIWTSILCGYARNGLPDEAVSFFIRCHLDGTLVMDEVALASVLRVCGTLGMLELSRQVHGFVTKSGIGPNVYIGAALIDMCTRCGRMMDAEKLLKSWPFEQAGSIIRTSILCGYARNGLPDEAISFFIQCYLDGTLVVDEVALASVLGVCGTLGIDKLGMQMHSLAFKTGYTADVGVGNSLVSMYAKCCCMEKAITLFDAMPKRDIVSWNCLIAGHVLHRQGDEALSVWSNMKSAGIKPDSITFMLVLSSYRHTSSNLVDQCRNLFDSMKRLHGVDPNSEHYASLVGVLGFWGLLKEAEEIIIGMPFHPDAAVWRALLDCCRLHMDMVMGKRIVKRILALKPKDPPTYVLVSNLYAASGLWHMSDMTRENMKEKRLQKQPCRSWIFNHDKVHSFYVRDNSHPETRDIYGGLDVLIMECLKAGYQPDTSFVLHELEEHQKKDFLFYHSAKLAVTYGLLSTKPGETIRIVKNILLCGDCHSFLKYVSSVTRREIVVRDTSGFHHFSNGNCSCRDHR